MKRLTFFLEILAVAVLVLQVFASDQKLVTVNKADKFNGVVIVAARSEGKSVELQCNSNMPRCNALPNGDYVMVELPKNHGMYMDCVNVDLYRNSTSSEKGEQVGEFCLMP